MTDWNPATRDEELRHISTVTKGIAAVAASGTVLLGVGIAWGDQQRVEQADARESETPPAPEASASPGATITAPKNAPTPSAAPTKSPKSKSGGS